MKPAFLNTLFCMFSILQSPLDPGQSSSRPIVPCQLQLLIPEARGSGCRLFSWLE